MNASKRKAMSFAAMQKSEAKLKVETEALMATAEQADVSDDAELKVGSPRHDIRPELGRREGRHKRIRAARAPLEADARAKENTSAAGAATARNRAEADREATEKIVEAHDNDHLNPPPTSGGEPTDEELMTHRTAATGDGMPVASAQRSVGSRYLNWRALGKSLERAVLEQRESSGALFSLLLCAHCFS